jgi:hypothetical protein
MRTEYGVSSAEYVVRGAELGGRRTEYGELEGGQAHRLEYLRYTTL